MLFWIKYETARTIGEDFFFSFVFFLLSGKEIVDARLFFVFFSLG